MCPFTGKTVVGLTGGIACGKTSALERFNHLGWAVVSADSLVAEILATNSEVKENIRQRWGEVGFDSFGNIDKSAILINEIILACPQWCFVYRAYFIRRTKGHI